MTGSKILPRFMRGALSAFLAVAGLGSIADTYYVARNGQTPGDFKSWGSASSNLADAVSAAAPGSTIHVADGVYYADGARHAVITDKTLYLEGNVEDPSKVVMDGLAGGYVYSPRGGIEIQLLEDGLEFEIRGFTFTNCSRYGGGGLEIEHGENTGRVLVENCVFTDNYCAGGHGAGVKFSGVAEAPFLSLIRNCYFANNNTTADGGGVYMWNTRLVIEDCVFRGNIADSSGGGVYLAPGESYLSLLRCEFYSNYSGIGGAVYPYTGNVVDATDCRFENNEAAQQGGAINSRGSLFITNSVFAGNTCTKAGRRQGGAIFMTGNVPAFDFVNGLVYGNISPGDGTNYTEAIYAANGSTGVYYIANSTIVDNSGGVKIYAASSLLAKADIVNCIMVDNTNSLGLLRNYDWPRQCERRMVNTCTDPLPASSTIVSIDNFTADPRFVSPESGDYRLLPGSPCINSGLREDWMSEATDLDGRPRVDVSGFVDIGCYEYVTPGVMLLIR